MPLIKEFLLQLLFIIVPVLLYKNVWMDRSKSGKQMIKSSLLVLLSSLSIILCMSFPVQVSGGLQFDLRSIPVIVTILYAGYIPGMIAFLVMIAFRFYLGGEGVLVTLFGGAVYAGISFLLVKRWCGYSLRKKLGISLLIGCAKQWAAITAASIVFLSQGLTAETAYDRLEPMFVVSVVNVLAMGGVVHLIEFIRESHIIRHQIERSEKLNLVSELAASVAHEVRNPLTVVRGFVQLLREESNPKNHEYIKLVLTELDRAEFIISDYLSLAKPEADVMYRIEMTDTVKEVAALMSSYAVMNGVEIVTETSTPMYVNSNSVKLKQALMNLMKNGIEAMPQGGVLYVTTEFAQTDVIITIRDEGEGMSAKQIEQIGLPFYSTKDKGTGLGLMVTCRIIEAMNGKISFSSEIGSGTQVTIRLPAV
jgi:two-component system sporulation sensor kinase B